MKWLLRKPKKKTAMDGILRKPKKKTAMDGVIEAFQTQVKINEMLNTRIEAAHARIALLEVRVQDLESKPGLKWGVS